MNFFKIEEIAYLAVFMGRLKQKAKKIIGEREFREYENVLKKLLATLEQNQGAKGEKEVEMRLTGTNKQLLRWFVNDVHAKMPSREFGQKKILSEIKKKVA